MFYLSGNGFVAGAAFVCLCALACWRPTDSLMLVPLFAPLYMHPRALGHEHFAPSEIFLLVALAACASPFSPIWRGPRAAVERVVRSPFFAPLCVFVLAACLSTAFAADRHHALQYFRLVVAEPVVFFVLLVALPRSRQDWSLLLASVVASALVVGLIGIAQYIAGTSTCHASGTDLTRLCSVYGSPDNVGLLFDRAIPIWAGLALGTRRGPFQIAAVVSGVILLGALYLTSSRGAWVGVAAALLAIVVWRFSWGRWLALACLIIAGAAVAARPGAVAHALSLGHARTAGQRVLVWQSSMHMIRDHPLLGIGPDNFIHYYTPRSGLYLSCPHGLGYMEPAAWREPCLSHPHNEALDFYLSTGPIGLVAFAWLEIVFWTHVWNSDSLRVPVLPGAGVTVGVAAAMAAALVHGLVDNSYFLLDLAILFWLLLAYIDHDARPMVASGATG